MRRTSSQNGGAQGGIHTSPRGPRSPLTALALAALALGALSACRPDAPDADPATLVGGDMVLEPPMGGDGHQVVEEGQSDFLSASGERGDAARDGDLEAQAPSAEDSAGATADDRTVEEGDIYRVVRPGLLANLNAYRGLQLVDIANTSAPRVLSRLALAGSPVEMYLLDGYALVLLNNWWGYWGGREDLGVESFNGGLVALVDVRDPSAPSLVSYQPVPGYIQTSRLTRSMAGDALYVVANDWSYEEEGGVVSSSGPSTVLRSFSVSAARAQVTQAGELDLGGYVADIQATPSTLLIARQQGWYWRDGDTWDGTYVSLVDISDPSGAIVEGGAVPVDGYVRRKNDLHIEGDVLRVVSADWRSGSVVSTWNISDLQEPAAIDSARFGEGEDLYASLFMSDRAFFVTYRRVDPFHAFSISPEGLIEERAEFVISGWNDFFRPVFDDARLVGVGQDDQAGAEGRAIAVSLYSTDLELASPFIGRAAGDLSGWSWSEAQWDDRAFSVIEGAVEVMSAGGQVETGLVLLPFSGYDQEERSWRSGVQMFTFSEESVTARGVMAHGSPVRRSFEPAECVVGNLSEVSLSLYDRANPDAPALLGVVDLAPELSRVFFVGEGPARRAVRLRGSNDLYYGWYDNSRDMEPARLQVMPVGADLDSAEPEAELEVPAFADIRQHGSTFVALEDRWSYDEERQSSSRDVRLSLFDLSDPAAPRARGALDLSARFGEDGGYYYGYGDDWGCWGCGGYWWGGVSQRLYPVEGGVAIERAVGQRETLGRYESCYLRERALPESDLPSCESLYGRAESAEAVSCQHAYSDLRCEREVGQEFRCEGAVHVCPAELIGSYNINVDYSSCAPVELTDADAAAAAAAASRRGECYEHERERYWSSLVLDLIDIRDLDAPALAASVERPAEERLEGVVADGATLYYSYHLPVTVEGDRVSYVRHFTRPIDLSDLSAPAVGERVNLPGRLLLRRGDLAVTRDLTWGPEGVESSLNLVRLNAEETRATLVSRHRFDGRMLKTVRLDEVGGEERLVVTHGPSYSYGFYYDEIAVGAASGTAEEEARARLDRVAVFGLRDLAPLGEGVSDQWSSLVDVRGGRAVFSVGGGVLLMDLSDPAQITPQAFFPVNGWGASFTLEGDTLYAAAGRFGVYALPLAERNLLAPPL